MNKIDTQIRHTTQPTDNIFADLGLDDAGHLKKKAETFANANLTLAVTNYSGRIQFAPTIISD